ncbi:MAG: membrane integrity-associated transporter subunit PqiC [Candidatus Hydrogenedentes bacterium]|nr:membrane integrity-associated transporter subunit PqiC [Candidatus Hydrogenedentota bacterium]
MTKLHAALAGILMTSVATLGGCLTAATISPTRYYTITPEIAVDAMANSGKSLGIRPLIGAKPYKLAVAYTAEDNRLAYYHDAEWADLPATMVNRALTDGLIKLEGFSEVDDAANIARPNFILTGELRRFEADYNRETPAAVVEIICIIRDTESGVSLWQGYVTGETPFPASAEGESLHSDASLASVAEAMSTSVASVVTQTCKKIGAAL